MIGITMDELNKPFSHYHDAEFVYHGTTYVLQPEINKGKEFLVIWGCTPDNAKMPTERYQHSVGTFLQRI